MKTFRYCVLILLALGMCILFVMLQRDPGIRPLSDDKIEQSIKVDDVTFIVAKDGRLFRVDEQTKRWHYHETVFDPGALDAAYRIDGQDVYRVDHENRREFKTRRQYNEGFEGLEPGTEGLRQLLGPERGWGELTLQSPRTPEVDDYVRLRAKILNGEGDFLDASVVPDSTRAHSGKNSLMFQTVAPTRGMICCKASISSPLVYFKSGDTFWFSAWFYAQKSLPSSLMDLESTWIPQRAGIRVMIDEQGHVLGELKALNKPKFRQQSGKEIAFPLDQWVNLKVQIFLSDNNEGHIWIWQDNQLIIDQAGTTFPLRRIIYDSLEIGISSHSYGHLESTLWVDDVEVSDKSFSKP